MKRIYVASILGVVASFATVATSHGSGSIIFDTYDSAQYQQILWINNPGLLSTFGFSTALAGTVVDSSFHAELYYGLGTGYTSFSQLTLVPNSETTVGSLLAGYVFGGGAIIPDYVSGPVTFSVAVWEASGTGSASTFEADLALVDGITGTSDLFVEPYLATGINPLNYFTAGVSQIFVGPTADPGEMTEPIPEPATFALAGLGTMTLLAFRRRQ